ncbi:Crp/Fnr family transcriptional regulator [Ralstonia pickettii]|nr:cyclic nucleotide-binding domain-containing protein [Ralstonia pickettii]
MIDRRISLAPGDVIFQAGERLHFLYKVKRGAVSSRITTSHGTEMIVAFHMPSELFGVDGVNVRKYGTTAQAITDSEICLIPYEDAVKLMSSSPEFQGWMMRSFSDAILREHQLITAIGQLRAEERFARFLIDLASRMQKANSANRIITLPMSRGDICLHLGMRIETLSRVLTSLVRERVLIIKKRVIEIIDPEGLQRIASLELGTRLY